MAICVRVLNRVLFLIGMMCDLIIGRIAQATGLRQDNGRAANCTVMLLSLRELQAQCKLRVAREGTHRAIRSSVDRGTVWLIQLITAERCQRCVLSGAIDAQELPEAVKQLSRSLNASQQTPTLGPAHTGPVGKSVVLTQFCPVPSVLQVQPEQQINLRPTESASACERLDVNA